MSVVGTQQHERGVPVIATQTIPLKSAESAIAYVAANPAVIAATVGRKVDDNDAVGL